MLIFIDESGDAGFKFEKGSSRYFVVALIIFDDDLDAEETALAIKKYRKSLNKSNQFEFKFNKANKKEREQFLRLDGLGEKLFKKEVTTYLRKELNKKGDRIFDSLKFIDSKKDVLIQLADMIASSTNYAFESSEKENHLFYKIISKRIEDCWKFR